RQVLLEEGPCLRQVVQHARRVPEMTLLGDRGELFVVVAGLTAALGDGAHEPEVDRGQTEVVRALGPETTFHIPHRPSRAWVRVDVVAEDQVPPRRVDLVAA